MDVIVVGAGAAGLMAAIAAAERGARVRLLDSQTKIGAKILVSGGGRCNVTNEFVDASRFHTEHGAASPSQGTSVGGGRSFVARVLRAFSVEDTHRFFDGLGVPLKLEETGKYFPVSDAARTVLNALLQAARATGVELLTGCGATGVRPDENGGWLVNTPRGPMRGAAVILCTGGLALPKSGSNGAGYTFATRLGHAMIATTPALSPLLANCPAHAALSGVALPARLTLRSNGGNDAQMLARYAGSFLFTHAGYSGPVALNISRHVARERWTYPNATVFLRLLPAVEDGDEKRFWHEFVRDNSRKGLSNALAEMLPRRAAEMVAAHCGAPHAAVGRLSVAQGAQARRALLDLPLPVHAVADYVKAEATAGGIALREIEPATMMSRLRPGLFFAGEICDVDGWLGGYNFQWAWSSGAVAGRAAARHALKTSPEASKG